MKEVAKTIQDTAVGPLVSRILDRSKPCDDLVDVLQARWAWNLFERRPGPAILENGVLKPTDLDLACFLAALCNRGAVINLPTYQGRRPRTVKEGEHVVSASNRHGKIVGLIANKDVFSFSVRIFDANVVVHGDEDRGTEDEVGAFRNFMLADIDGSWHDGWKKIEFVPSRKENAFLDDKKLWTGNVVYFENFVHPMRWTSFYGQHYLATKLLMDRLTEEASHLRAECKRLSATGIKLPPSEERPKAPQSKVEGPQTSEKVKAFECEVDYPEGGKDGGFAAVEASSAALAVAAERARKMSYTWVPALRFPTRATELAFFNRGMKEAAMPAWIRGAKWESYTPKGTRTEWQRLVLHQTFPGQTAFALRYRTYDKTERVAGGGAGEGA
jgi:hypothetical protein